KQSLWFVCGFSLVFIVLGASATLLGQWMMANLGMLSKGAGVIIFVFGVHYTGLIRIPFLMFEARVDGGSQKQVTHGLGALILGSAFAFGWTPCVGPILAAILVVAGGQDQIFQGVFLLATYSAGLAVPFLLAALATERFIRFSKRFRKYLHRIEVVSGILLMVVGAMIFLGSFSRVSGWLIDLFPFLVELESLVQ
ncbi:MAG: cytochrome c biogenesis protein CcdA, partial [Mariprofundaceae bacterium]